MNEVKHEEFEVNGILTPSGLEIPAYLMNIPFSLSADQPNNIWMQEELQKGKEIAAIRLDRAINQWMDLYNYMASESFVQLLPTPKNCKLQDLTFTANMGVVLEHKKNIVIMSNFTSKPRIGEEKIGMEFFKTLGYDAMVCPFRFEGSAELKHLKDNIYIGGYGERSDIKAYEWMEQNFDMKVIKLEEKDPYLYHLDCSVFPIMREEVMIANKIYTPAEMKELEKYANIIPLEDVECWNGICNSVRMGNTILNASYIDSLKAGTDEYYDEISKNRILEDIAVELGFQVTYFDLSEFFKSGALLSCLVMELNRNSYNIQLI